MVPLTRGEASRIEALELRVSALTDAVNGVADQIPRQGKFVRFITQGWVVLALLSFAGAVTARVLTLWVQMDQDHEQISAFDGKIDRMAANQERILSAQEDFCSRVTILWAKRGESITCTRTTLQPVDGERRRWR